MELTRRQSAVRWLVVGVGLLYALVPVLWVLTIALRPRKAFRFPRPLIPTRFPLSNVHEVVSGGDGIGWLPYANAAIYGVGAAAVTAIIALLGGYALGRYDSRYGRALLLVFLALSLLPDAA